LSPNPLVSVVVPVLNGERHVGTCLASVLSQTYRDLEVVVSLNASRDATSDVVRSFDDTRLRILPEPPSILSVHENWTRALSAANGELVKLVCHDDVLLPDGVRIQTELLQRHPSAVLVSGRRRIIDDNGATVIAARGLGTLLGPADTREVGASEIARACTRAGTNLLGEPASVLIRRSALPDPLLDPRWSYAMDLEFYLRCIKGDPVVVDGRVLGGFRASPTQMSAMMARDQTRELRALLNEMPVRYPGVVRREDVRRGIVMAELQTAARRALYLRMRWSAHVTHWARRVRRHEDSTVEHF
jgi:glycosyltransferase involved in cell wall biosynthesis